jgi:DNA-binding beta-propeller fold protein YncE
VWVTARTSNNIVVFDRSKLDTQTNADGARMGRVRVGKSPTDLKFLFDGTLVAVANSDRFFTSGSAKTSVSVFDVTAILNQLAPNTRLLIGACSLRKTPNTNGSSTDFPRNFAVDDERLYVTLAKNVFLQHYNLADLILDGCP